ncbi:MAG: hypothetical protein L0Y66_00415 [Myxococcaceae bacterium]|nr:hypothetical protein [Myxococcaceae bacterium]MCI0673615.1 hypothetical protein [Myxococcaceae bacterium]
MAVRTDIVGIKRKRRVSPGSAQPSQGTTSSRKLTLPRDEAAALRRELNVLRATPGPAAKKAVPKSGRAKTTVQGRKKAPSQMKVKSRGGPKRRMPLHGG